MTQLNSEIEMLRKNVKIEIKEVIKYIDRPVEKIV